MPGLRGRFFNRFTALFENRVKVCRRDPDHPYTALTVTTLAALYFFAIRRGLSRDEASKMAPEALLPVGTLICIMGGGGALKQIIVDSGVGGYAGNLLMTSAISPLLVVWLIAAAMRLAQGSATVAII